MAELYRCPRCKSNRVRVGYPNIECRACGWSEPLIDFPISWDWHRHYCVEYGLPDPGPCEPAERPELKAIEERLESVEQRLTALAPEDLRQFKLKHIYDEVEDLRRGFRHIDQVVANLIRARARPRKISRGVPL